MATLRDLPLLPPLRAPRGGFTPLAIAGLQLWLRADALALNDGDQVATWPDQSGNGRDWTQPTSTKRPLFKANILNGKPVVRFDGIDDALNNAGVSVPSTRTIIAVFTDNGSDAYGAIFTFGTSQGWYFRGPLHVLSEYYGADHLSTVTIPAGTAVVFSEIYSPSTLSFFTNGAASGFGAAGTPTANLYNSIGDDSGSETFKGDLAELMFYNSALSTANRQSVEHYLGLKYGIAGL